MYRFPHDYRAQLPGIRLTHLDPRANGTVLVGTFRDGPNRQLVGRPVTRPELRLRREVHSLRMRLTPGIFTERPGAGRGGVLLPLGLQPLRIGKSKAGAGTEPCPALVGGLVSEGLAAPLTGFFHTFILASGGLMTVPYCAVRMGRRGVGIELNSRYFADGAAYVKAAADEASAPTLFDLPGVLGEAS